MKINEASWDSVVRIFGGFILIYLGQNNEPGGVPATLAGLLGLFLLLTGVIGFCPVYTLFGRKK